MTKGVRIKVNTKQKVLLLEKKKQIEEIEIKLLLEGIYQHYGYDFRDYAVSSLKRRIKKSVEEEDVETISGFQEKILHDSECMLRFIDTMSVNVTEMFRDPKFYLSFRKNVVPKLKLLNVIRIWHAGCSTGEEVYSMAILLKEEGILDKCMIYATDMNGPAVQKAKEGIYSLKFLKDYTDNYFAAGGEGAFSKYYYAKYNNTIMKPDLSKKIVWSEHNLVTDSSFNEFDVVLCRNVMIYFNNELQNHVHKLIYDSLTESGFLVLGSKENIKFSPYEKNYEDVDTVWKIYRKVK